MYRIVFLILIVNILLSAQDDMKKILILHSYSPSFSWTNDVQKGISSVIDSTKYKTYIEYMDTKKYNNQLHYKNLIQLYKNKYQNLKLDAIIVSDNNALNFIKHSRKLLFKDTPIIFCGINYLKQSDINGLQNISGINEEPNLIKNIELIKKLHPENKNIYIVIDSTTTGKIMHTQLNKILKELPKDKIKYEILQGYSLAKLKEYLKYKKGIILLTVYFKDNDNTTYEYYELVKELNKNSVQPLYGLWDMNLGNGLVGGYLTSGLFQGKEAAKITKRVLLGEDINSIDMVLKSPNKYMFDYNQMKKHKIKINNLPKEHYLINYEKTFFQKYKKELIFIMTIILILVVIVLVLLKNIQKRKIAEINLLESERQLQKQLYFLNTLINAVNIPIYYKDKNFVYMGCNKRFESYLGIDSEEIIGKKSNEIGLNEDYVHSYINSDNKLFENGESQEFKSHIVDSNGTIKDIIFYKSPFYDLKGNIAGLIGSIFDVTEMTNATKEIENLNKNLEEKIKERTEELSQTIQTLKLTQDKLIYSEKMSALSGLVAGIAHEMNTPVGLSLTGVSHFLEITENIKNLFENNNLSENDLKEYIDTSFEVATIVLSNLDKSVSLIKSFKQISVDQESEIKRSFNLKNYIDEILIGITNFTNKRNISLHINCEDIEIESYPGALSQIISNLIMNSLFHAFKSDEKGDIFIDIKIIQEKIVISFRDNGKGIKEEDLEKIFNPFFTTNREFGGTGLGLSIIYNIIKSTFNGEITCKSTLGEGTEFSIELYLSTHTSSH